VHRRRTAHDALPAIRTEPVSAAQDGTKKRDDGVGVRIGTPTAPDERRENVGIGPLREPFERIALLTGSIRVTLIQVRGQQEIELFRSPAAAPSEAPRDRNTGPLVTARLVCHGAARVPGAQLSRATIIFLISAMALAGLRPFGQVFVQFMIVWQR